MTQKYAQSGYLFNEIGHNRYLFSNYYLEHFLKELEDWKNFDEESEKVLKAIGKLEMPKEGANESQTENKWIRPILDLLGHHYNVNVSINTPLNYKAPDYIFYPDEKIRKQEEGINYKDIRFREKALAVGEAKTWNRDLDKQLKEETVFEGRISQNPTYQIDFYIRHTELDWGILTNGKIWRLYHKDSSRKLDVYYWVDLEKLIHPDNSSDNFKYFYLFFRRQAFIKNGFLDTVLKGSREHAQNVGEKLNEEVFKALELLMEGFINFSKNKLETTQENLILVYDNSLILLYRLLFVLYAESRGLLIDRKYKKYYGLHQIIQKLIGDNENYDLKTKYCLWDNLHYLWEVLHEGNKEIRFKAYNGGLFDPQKHPFLEKYKVGDLYLAEALKKLAYIDDKNKNINGFINYSDLDIRHLGSIYEGLLEYNPQKVYDQNNGYKIVLLNDKGERKITGSYYTPDYIVKYIVEQTINPVIDKILEKYDWGNNGLQRLVVEHDEKKSLINKILSIKILDPAMGSGHFLVEAADFMANKLVELGIKPEELEQEEKRDETQELAYWRRKVLQSCIYGVDINPLAVELAKVALWLSTASKNKPLNFLDHHLRCGNSLVGARMIDLKAPNPKKEMKEELPLFEKDKLDTTAHKASEAITKIENKEINTFQDAKEVESIYENEVRPTLEKYRILSDLWTAQHFGLKIDAQIWRSLSDYVLKGTKQLKEAHEYVEKATEISEKFNFFHWELEFPEVFFEREETGFDVVIGNPPYIRQEKIKDIKSHLSEQYITYNGMADIFVYFFEKGINFVKPEGYFSFIVSNKFTRANYGIELRNFILQNTNILSYLDQFKEKRVFKEATVDPCIIVLRKTPPDEKNILIYNNEVEVKQKFLNSTSWSLKNTKALKLKQKIKSQGLFLKDWDIKIYRGILTGYNKAFIIDGKTKNELIQKDRKNAEIIKPLLRGRNIDRYNFEFNDKWLINTGFDLDIPKLYPSIYEWLRQFEKKLKKRYDQGKNWWNLRSCDYYEEFEKDKIIYAEMTKENNFTWDDENYYTNQTCYIIPNSNKYLLTILNSKLIYFYMALISSTLGKGAFRWIKQYVEQLPIPKIPEIDQQPFVQKADIMLAKNKELQELKTKFTEMLQSRLKIDKISKNLENWNELRWKQFEKELKKKGVKLTLEQEEDWRDYFEKKKREAQKIQKEIDRTDKEIEKMVYKLYGLTQEEIDLVENS